MSKRDNVLDWQDYYMNLAFLAAERSKDPVTKVGAVIVDEDTHHIISMGYNGFPVGCSDDDYPWGKDPNNMLNNKHTYVVHAELNAILNSKQNLTGKVMYTTLYPCNECTKAIIQSGIKAVYYEIIPDNPNYKHEASSRMLDSAGVTIQEYKRDQFIHLIRRPSKKVGMI